MSKMVVFLSIGLFFFSHNANSLPIDLTAQDVFIRKGFERQLIENFQSFDPSQWNKIAAAPNHRSLSIAKVVLENIPKPGLFEYADRDYEFTFLFFVPFSAKDLRGKAIGLYLAQVGQNWQVYLNGHLIRNEAIATQSGRIVNKREMRRVVVELPHYLLRASENMLAFRIIGDPTIDRTGFYMKTGYSIDRLHILQQRQDDRVELVLIGIYFFFGLYHLLLYIRRRQEIFNLWFALGSSFLSVYYLARSNLALAIYPDSSLMKIVELQGMVWLLFFFCIFTDAIVLGKVSIFTRIYFVYSLLVGTLIVLFEREFLKIWQMSAPIIMLYIILWDIIIPLYSEYQRFSNLHRQKILPIRIGKALSQAIFFSIPGNIMLGMVVLLVTVTVDIYNLANGYPASYSRYGFFVLVMGIVLTLANRFLRIHEKIEDLNVNLEQKVQERTSQLKKSLDDIQALKEQQDGDYFLTSLLVDPLNAKSVNNSNIKVDFYIKEKKTFQFRKWQKEIGGDMCMAHSIKLRDRWYTFFINADAMGKSIQGAGGVLVMGSLLKAIVERTIDSPMEKKLFPEKWLRNTFVELQKVFKGFNGSMLMSLVMGLADEQTGLVYFINAEHPWTILYRDGKASFIEEKLTFHKIGTDLAHNKIWFQLFAMRSGDSLIMGSDGRDDIALGRDLSNDRMIINEDEFLILNRVEEGKGQLSDIADRIRLSGELTDDLSLLKISYHEQTYRLKPLSPEAKELIKKTHRLLDNENQPIKEEDGAIASDAAKEINISKTTNDIDKIILQLSELVQKQPHVLTMKILARLTTGARNYKDLLQSASYLAENMPEDSSFIYLAAFAAKKMQKLDLAADYGERFRLRRPMDIRNLINLADIYRLMGNEDRSRKMLQYVLQQDSNHNQALKLDAMLKIKS